MYNYDMNNSININSKWFGIEIYTKYMCDIWRGVDFCYTFEHMKHHELAQNFKDHFSLLKIASVNSYKKCLTHVLMKCNYMPLNDMKF